MSTYNTDFSVSNISIDGNIYLKNDQPLLHIKNGKQKIKEEFIDVQQSISDGNNIYYSVKYDDWPRVHGTLRPLNMQCTLKTNSKPGTASIQMWAENMEEPNQYRSLLLDSKIFFEYYPSGDNVRSTLVKQGPSQDLTSSQIITNNINQYVDTSKYKYHFIFTGLYNISSLIIRDI